MSPVPGGEDRKDELSREKVEQIIKGALDLTDRAMKGRSFIVGERYALIGSIATALIQTALWDNSSEDLANILCQKQS